jgi:hypothetical protein
VGEPKGFLVVPTGEGPTGKLRGLTVDADGYLQTALSDLGGAAGLGDPKGYLITPVAVNPSGKLRTLEMDASDYLLIALLGGTVGQILASDGTKGYWANPEDIITGGYTEGARVYNSAAIATVTSVWKLLTFDTERYDTDGIHEGVTNPSRLTCKTAGKYFFGCCVSFQSNATGYRIATINHNGTPSIVQNRSPAVSGDSTILSCNAVYDLAVNDYLEVFVYQNRGGALNVESIGNVSPEFWMQRIG